MKTNLENYIQYLYDFMKKQEEKIIPLNVAPHRYIDIYGEDNETADLVYLIFVK